MPPSNTSSPLSDAASLPNSNDDDIDDSMIDNQPGPSRLISPNEPRRRSRSATSSTERRPSRDDDSDLSDLSEEEEGEQEEMGIDSDGDEEDGDVEEQEPGMELPRSRLPSTGYRNSAGVAAKASPEQQESGVNDTAYQSDSDTNSLSPPPPSTGPKTQALPEVEPAPQGSLLEEEESDLESLTDSNSNGDALHEEKADEAKEENMSESERPEEEDEEEGDGDVTMRAGDLELEVEGDEEKEEEREEIAEETHVDESGGHLEQETQADEEAQTEEPVEEEVEEAPPSPALSIQPFRPHSSHPPPPTSAAVKALFGLEIKFAAMRDRLYVERMEETAAEEEMILNGTHPAVSYLFKNLRARRERLHEVASRRHKQVLEEILKVKDENKEAVWTWWTDERDREQWEEFQDTWQKRRRLIREKGDLEHIPSKRPKAIPKSWADMPKPLDWAAGAVPAPMPASDAASDLAKMDPRRYHPSIPLTHSRQGSPQRYATPPTHTSNSSSFAPYTFHPEEGFQHPQYAQRVPGPSASHHTIHRIGQGPSGSGSGSGSSQGQPGYGPAVFNEPRREGRTVPTSSALFDSGRRSNEGTTTIQQQPQAPPPAPGLGAELWGKDRTNGQGQGHGQGHSLVTGPNGRGVGISNGSNGNGNGNVNGNGNGKEIGETTTTTNGHKEPTPPEAVEQKPKYPALTGFLTSTSPNQTPQPGQQAGKVSSPPKSSLGITGIPSGMPFI